MTRRPGMSVLPTSSPVAPPLTGRPAVAPASSNSRRHWSSNRRMATSNRSAAARGTASLSASEGGAAELHTRAASSRGAHHCSGSGPSSASSSSAGIGPSGRSGGTASALSGPHEDVRVPSRLGAATPSPPAPPAGAPPSAAGARAW
eukprot:scaffold23509_cov107-Isochrysis_galbana.AAC.2